MWGDESTNEPCKQGPGALHPRYYETRFFIGSSDWLSLRLRFQN